MKKVALLVALLMVISATPGWCLVAAVDRALDNQSKSDLRPVEDTAKLAGMVNKGVDKSYNMVTEPIKPVLDPVRKVRDTSIHATKDVLNKIWDVMTFASHRKK